MKLYSLIGHAVIEDPVHGRFERDDLDGSFELPMELARSLHAVHIAGAPAWEDENERTARLIAEEDARRRDPATLLAAVEAATAAALLAAMPTPVVAPVPVPPGPVAIAKPASVRRSRAKKP